MPLKRLATLLVVTGAAVAAVAAVALAASGRDAGPTGIHLTPLSSGAGALPSVARALAPGG